MGKYAFDKILTHETMHKNNSLPPSAFIVNKHPITFPEKC
jgi:hypothetical protein